VKVIGNGTTRKIILDLPGYH